MHCRSWIHPAIFLGVVVLAMQGCKPHDRDMLSEDIASEKTVIDSNTEFVFGRNSDRLPNPIGNTPVSITNFPMPPVGTLVLYPPPAPAHSVVKKITNLSQEPFYAPGEWALKVVDIDSGEVLYDIGEKKTYYIGSVRKLFSVGELLNAVGANFHFITPVFYDGFLYPDGVLKGNLILQASGDLTMGGRLQEDNTLDVPDYDHNEANSLGNAKVAPEDPLFGFKLLAAQIAASGITRVDDVVIDDRLFKPFNFRDEFDVKPIFVNDDVVDVEISPTSIGSKAEVIVSPTSRAFKVVNNLMTVATPDTLDIVLNPALPECFGDYGCHGEISGEIGLYAKPPAPFDFSPIVRVFRITDPAAYARTVLIEALQDLGVEVIAPDIAQNPAGKLPDSNIYPLATRVAELVSPAFLEYAKYILKVSYNIGADTSLVLFGLTQGVDTQDQALDVEQDYLASLGIDKDSYHFVDGSGGGETTATTHAVTKMLLAMSRSFEFPIYYDSLPILGVDGSLASVKDFTHNDKLKGALGNVAAKTGTYITSDDLATIIKAQNFAGYIRTKNNRRLAYALFVNNIPSTPETIFTDIGKILSDLADVSALIWADN